MHEIFQIGFLLMTVSATPMQRAFKIKDLVSIAAALIAHHRTVVLGFT